MLTTLTHWCDISLSSLLHKNYGLVSLLGHLLPSSYIVDDAPQLAPG